MWKGSKWCVLCLWRQDGTAAAGHWASLQHRMWIVGNELLLIWKMVRDSTPQGHQRQKSRFCRWHRSGFRYTGPHVSLLLLWLQGGWSWLLSFFHEKCRFYTSRKHGTNGMISSTWGKFLLWWWIHCFFSPEELELEITQGFVHYFRDLKLQ